MAEVRPIPPRYLSPAPSGEMGFLFSYHYMGKYSLKAWMLTLGHSPLSFVDSGGFSAFTQGAKIDLKKYVSWLRLNAEAITVYANLDEIGDPRGTFRNQLRMEAEGLRPLPVVHYGTSADEIERYADRGYDYLCLGGMVPHLSSMSQARRLGKDHEGLRWLDSCHEAAQARGVGLHGFGVTGWSLLRGYPWRSVDSSSWSVSVRYGRLMVFDPSAGCWTGVPIRDAKSVMRMAPVLRSYGADPLQIIRDAEHTRRHIVLVAIRSWVAAMRWMRERGQPTQVYIVTAPDFGSTDPEMRNAARIAAGMPHRHGVPLDLL